MSEYTITIWSEAGIPTGQLKNITEPLVAEGLDGELTFSFKTVLQPDLVYLNDQHRIFADDIGFRPARVRKSRGESNIVTVECEAECYKLNEHEHTFINEDGEEELVKEYEDTLTNIVLEMLSDTDFVIGANNLPSDVFLYEPKPSKTRARLIEIAKLGNCEIQWDELQIHFIPRRGADRGLSIELGVNLVNLVEEIDFREGGARYSYEIDALDLSKIPGYESTPYIHLGDDVTIVEPTLNINRKLRIVYHEFNPFDKTIPRVQVGNVVRDLSDIVHELVTEDKPLAEVEPIEGIEKDEDGNMKVTHESGSYIIVGHDIRIHAKGKIYLEYEGVEA